jgi:hypothetical protein
MSRTCCGLAVMLGLWIGSGEASADIVTLSFTGSVTSVPDNEHLFGGQVKVGDPFSVTLTYDSTIPNSGSGDVGEYAANTNTPPLGMTLNVDNFSFVPYQPAGYGYGIRVSINQGSPTPDSFAAGGALLVGANGADSGVITLGDSTGTALTSVALPTSINLNAFDQRQFVLFSEGGFNLVGTINGSVVPEPSAWVLIGMGLMFGLGIFGRRART